MLKGVWQNAQKEGQPICDVGIVFFKGADKSYQACASDGEGVILTNEVSQEQAEKLHLKVQSFSADPKSLSLEQFKSVLSFASEELNLVDPYDSDRNFTSSKITFVSGHRGGDAFGLMKRDGRDICRAVLVIRPFSFQGPAATAQQFSDAGVIVQQGGNI